jgi:protein O-GlcNAc transferase
MRSTAGRSAARRAELRGRMQASPLLDYERFTRELEKLYRRLWRRWAEAA